MLTAAQRRLRASIAAHESHAKHDPRERIAAAAAATPQGRPYWQRKVADEHPDLDAAEVERRAEHLYRAHMQRLALKSSKARQAKRPITPPTGGEAA
jgi:hypothetical protein